MHPNFAISRFVALTLGAILASSPLLAAEEAPPGAAAGEAERLRAELLAKMAEINARQKQLQEQMQAADQRRRELELIIGRADNAGQQGAGQDRKPAPAAVAAERKAEQDSQRDKPPELPRVSADVGGVLTPRGRLVVEPSFQYIYSSVQRVAIDGYTIAPILIGRIQVVEADRDTLVGSLTTRYGVTNRLEAELRAPYVYRRDSTRTRPITGAEDEKLSTGEASDFGDLEFDLRYQLPRPSVNWPYLVTNLRTKIPTGTDPFDLQAEDDDLPTGSGFWSLSPGLTYIYPSDPVVFFGNIGYLWTIKDRKNREVSVGGTGDGVVIGDVNPGDAVRMSFGMGFSLNDRSSFSLSYSLDLFGRTTIESRSAAEEFFAKETIAGSDITIGKLLIGYSLRLPGGQPLNLAIGIGATDDAPDTDVTFRLPFTVLN